MPKYIIQLNNNIYIIIVHYNSKFLLFWGFYKDSESVDWKE